MVSIIIRTKNEERWITLCLKAVFSQEYRDFEVIIVDNKSTDLTLAKAKEFKVRTISINEYLPGKALNAGIRAARGELICCLSGHCIPVNAKWLTGLVNNFKSKHIAGVYGRQEPMTFTGDFDKRDLRNVFGLDRRVQKKDSFFHNANSMIRRSVWAKLPFSEEVTNIEDRVWATEVLKQGGQIVYEPRASVYHYHGIHQDNNQERCSNVVRILESLDLKHIRKFDIKNLNVVALVPIKGQLQQLDNKPLIEYTLQRCRDSKYISRTIVSTDNAEVARQAKKCGAQVPFLRDPALSAEHVDLDKVLQFSLEEIEKRKIFPDVVVVLEATYPFRQFDLIDTMIRQLVDKGLDSVIPVRLEYKSCWTKKEDDLKRIDAGFIPRSLKEPLYIGLPGLACVTHPVFIREGKRIGEKLGFVEVHDPYSSIEVRSDKDLELAQKIIADWWHKGSA